MRVNSASDSLFTNGVFVRSGIVVVLVMCVSVVFAVDSSQTARVPETEASLRHVMPTEIAGRLSPGEKEIRMKQVNLLIRLIGYQLLLQAGDSTSRVLPVTEVKEGTFTLQLEKPFLFSHDSLIVLSQNYFPKSRFPSGYTVTVHDCLTASIVYGFQINNTTPDILACQGRHEPKGCYLIEFAFADLYASAGSENVDIKSIGKRKSLQQNKPAASVNDTDLSLEERISSLPTHQSIANPSNEQLEPSSSTYPLTSMLYTSILISLGVTLVLARVGIFLKPKRAITHNDQTIRQPETEFAALGKLQFDVEGQRLLSSDGAISLTEKECKILELLNNAFGELVTRETLMQKIWLDEGVITGRSLDMFVSKLRKKLSADPELRITNVHGKGYKLE